MKIIPAIDLMDGKVVRLKLGKKDDYIVYSSSPVDMALEFEKLGADRIHIVDLDAAFGSGNNRKIIREMAEKLRFAQMEIGGGIRTIDDVKEVLCCKAQKVILGTMPIKNPSLFRDIVDEFKDKIIVGVDVENGFVKISGWVENSKADYISFLEKMQEMGIKEAIVTDITKDGMLSGVDDNFYRNIALKTNLRIIISGGVKDENDIKKAKNLEKYGVYGVIIGKAIYEKTIDLKAILEKYR